MQHVIVSHLELVPLNNETPLPPPHVGPLVLLQTGLTRGSKEVRSLFKPSGHHELDSFTPAPSDHSPNVMALAANSDKARAQMEAAY